jgi:hypothetical protein
MRTDSDEDGEGSGSDLSESEELQEADDINIRCRRAARRGTWRAPQGGGANQRLSPSARTSTRATTTASTTTPVRPPRPRPAGAGAGMLDASSHPPAHDARAQHARGRLPALPPSRPPSSKAFQASVAGYPSCRPCSILPRVTPIDDHARCPPHKARHAASCGDMTDLRGGRMMRRFVRDGGLRGRRRRPGRTHQARPGPPSPLPLRPQPKIHRVDPESGSTLSSL